ncbi:MAG TPA: glycosyltransferase [Sulfuricurvum sp.]|nr:glycosyltransferase [Sulfuricurvum sp.]
MHISVIIATYKDTTALRLIFQALDRQSFRAFEVVVAEDAEDEETRRFLQQSFSFPVKHFSHPDKGVQKARAINGAIRMCAGDYLVFIDGDVIPFTTFLDAHAALAEPGHFLCGRRVNLGDSMSQRLRREEVDAATLQKRFLRNLPAMLRDNGRHFEQGFYINPRSKLYTLWSQRDTNVHLLGSNFSVYKEAVLKINGIDEELYGGWNDYDIEWRLIAAGLKPKTCKYAANLFHLNHPRSGRKERNEKQKAYIEAKIARNEYVSQKGLKQH